MIKIKLDGIKKAIQGIENIQGQMSKQKRRAFFRIGSYVRGVMRRLIRRGKKPSQPGQPPKSHTGLLRNSIFYIVHQDGVQIGPALLRGTKGDAKPVGQNVPELLEFGGEIKIKEVLRRGRWQRVKKYGIRDQGKPKRDRIVTIAPRSYAKRALDIARKKDTLTKFFKLVGPGRVNA